MSRGGNTKRFSDAERKTVEGAITNITGRNPDIGQAALHAAVLELTGITISLATVVKWAKQLGKEHLAEPEAQPPVIRTAGAMTLRPHRTRAVWRVTPVGENEVEVYICVRCAPHTGYDVARAASTVLAQTAAFQARVKAEAS